AGHTSAVAGAQFTQDGKRLVTWSSDAGTEDVEGRKVWAVKVWEAGTGKENLAFLLKGHRGEAIRVALSPDGQRLASASEDGAVKLWDLAAGQETRTLWGHARAVSALSFSPDGQRLASASYDGVVKVWDVNTGGLAFSLPGHRDLV